MAVFQVYVDESGKLSGKDEYTSLCGYVAHAQEWQRVGAEWDACRMRWGVPPIHMARIMWPDRKDDDWKKVKDKWGARWENLRKDMLDDFSRIIGRASVACIGALVDANAYRKIQKDPECVLHFTDTNVFAFQYAIMSSLAKTEAVNRYSPVSIIVDDDQEHAFDYYKMLDALRTHPDPAFQKVRDRLHGICFCNDASYPGLQAADMISYVARRHKIEKSTSPISDVLPLDLYSNLTMMGLHQPIVYTEELLYKIARGTAEALKEQATNENVTVNSNGQVQQDDEESSQNVETGAKQAVGSGEAS